MRIKHLRRLKEIRRILRSRPAGLTYQGQLIWDLWNLFRGTLPREDGLNYAFEKGGVTLENQPIP